MVSPFSLLLFYHTTNLDANKFGMYILNWGQFSNMRFGIWNEFQTDRKYRKAGRGNDKTSYYHLAEQPD